MSDISAFQSGAVDDSGKVNWRGDQIAVPQGGQSIYKTSSVPLTELGARKVVGDRVFRYALCGNLAAAAGDLLGIAAASVINVTAGNTDPQGGFTFTWYSATAVAKDYWSEGTLVAQSGTAANTGFTYRVKNHAAIGTTSNGTLFLYDPLVNAINVTDKYSLHQNIYSGVLRNTAGTQSPAGVAPIAITSGDYFWMQTWGPCPVKAGAGTVNQPLVAGATGAVTKFTQSNTVDGVAFVGYALQTLTASEKGLAFLTIAP